MSVSAVRELGERLALMVRDFDPAVCDGQLAAAYVDAFAHVERLAAAGKTLAVARVESTRAWATGPNPARTTAEWLAARTGTPLVDAIRDTNIGRKVQTLPATEAALRDGQLSAAQAAEVTDTAIVAPGAEADLLDMARGHQSLARLRDRARRVKAAAEVDAERAARQHGLRGARRWSDTDGMRCYGIKLTPTQAVTFEPVWECFTTQVFHTARADGTRDAHEAYAADALVAMAAAARPNRAAERDPNGDGTDARPGSIRYRRKASSDRSAAPVNVHALLIADLTALRRGHTTTGERCEIAGIGPIDVPAAKALLGDAVIDLLVTDGIDVRTVAHTSRHPNRRQRAALLLDWECEIRGCTASRGLEIDHIEPWAHTGRTAIEALGPKCHWHHHLKTNQGYTDGPRGGDGKRDLLPPGPEPPGTSPPGDPPTRTPTTRPKPHEQQLALGA